MNRRRESLAWAAGFFDGEGTTAMRLVLGRPGRMVLTITQADDRVLRIFGQAIGIGRLNGPYVSRRVGREHCKQTFQFTISNFEGVQHAVASMWPWLGEAKREQAALALKTYTKAWRQWKADGRMVKQRPPRRFCEQA